MIFRRFYSKLAANYKPLPVTMVKGRDVYLFDKDGKRYVDLLAGYSVVNQGHCHPRIVEELVRQSKELTIASRNVIYEKTEAWAERLCRMMGYNCVLPTNTGTEAVETALKLVRRYGRRTLGIKDPHIVCLTGNYHGRTLGSLSMSDYPDYRKDFGPFLGDIITVQMNNVVSLKAAFEYYGSKVAAIIYEPIQGEGGIVPMTKQFYREMQNMKLEFPGVLTIADEIQSGLGRSGPSWTAGEYLFNDMPKPDLILLGKALGGGVYPISCIVGSRDIIGHLNAGSHGSTFGGNPLACAVSLASLDVLEMECLGKVRMNMNTFRDSLYGISKDKNVEEIRGSGFFWGIQFRKNYDVEHLRLKLLEKGFLTCSSRNNMLRLTPPLTMSNWDIFNAVDVIGKTI